MLSAASASRGIGRGSLSCAVCALSIPLLNPLMKDIHHERRQRLTGIALMCGAVALFALLDTAAKYLSAQMPTSQIVAARYITAFLLALVLVNPITHPRLVVTGRPVLQIVRSVLMLATTVFNFIAVRYLQLDQTLSIMFSAPFLVALLAGPFLGERLDWRRWAAITVGFAGVLLVTRPGTGRHPSSRAAHVCRCALLCRLRHHDPGPCAHRFQRNDIVLY